MYNPNHFKIKDEETIFDMIEKYSFATLISQHKGAPYATHLPLLLNRGDRVLYGHFARANEQWKDVDNQNILVIFHGPHCYISPSWYETTKAVPTWNYVSIHLYGELEIINDPKFIYDSLSDMIVKYESRDSKYNLSNVDPGYIDGLQKGIVAFKININKIDAKAKLSQNHPVERQELIIRHLEKTSSEENKRIASLMKKNMSKNEPSF
jgi:transcriptional regulator